MDNEMVINIWQLSKVYLLLVIVLAVLKKAKIKESKLLFVGSIRMTIQLFLAGYLLTEIFNSEKPIFTILYLIVMVFFSSKRIFNKNQFLNKKFKKYIVLAIGINLIFTITFFTYYVLEIKYLNPRYTVPISGMIVGNSMNALMLGLKTLETTINKSKLEISTLLNLGVCPKKILIPFVNLSLETALIPSLNAMVSIGLISLPGIMSGQILAGSLPLTAIMYQIAIMIILTSSVTLTVFISLYLGYRTLINKKGQIVF